MSEDFTKDPQFNIGFGYNTERAVSGMSDKCLRLALENKQREEFIKSADDAIKNADKVLAENAQARDDFNKFAQGALDGLFTVLEENISSLEEVYANVEAIAELDKTERDVEKIVSETNKLLEDIKKKIAYDNGKKLQKSIDAEVYSQTENLKISIDAKNLYSNKKVFGDEETKWSPPDDGMSQTLTAEEQVDLRNAMLKKSPEKEVSLPGYYYLLKKSILPAEEDRLTQILTDAGYNVACGLVFEFFGLDPLKFNINGFIEIPSLVPPSFNVDLCEVFRYLYNKKTAPNIGLALPRILGQFAGIGLIDLTLPKLKMPKFDLNISVGISVCDIPFGQGNCLPKSMTANYFENTLIPKINNGLLDNTIEYYKSVNKYRLLQKHTPEKTSEMDKELKVWTDLLNKIKKGRSDEEFLRSVYIIYSETQLKEKSPELFK